jgi:RNA polymerase sigma-70 factor (ECF subfamily)
MVNANALNSESELVAAAINGRADAFGELVQQYRERLLSAVTTIVRCPADAEDIVQDAFIQAYIKLASFKGKSSFYTWIYRISVNMALSRSRRQRVRAVVERTRDILGEDPQDPSESPETRMMRNEHAMQIKQAFDSLREDQRIILKLRGVDECDYETIALRMELKPGTVRSRLHRARTELREQLDDAMYCHA